MARQSTSVYTDTSERIIPRTSGGRLSSGDSEFTLFVDSDDDDNDDGMIRERYIASSFCCIVLGLYGRSNHETIGFPVSLSCQRRVVTRH